MNGNLTAVAEMHHVEHSTAAADCWWQYSLNHLDEELSKSVGVMSVEVDAGLCHVTRLMKITDRARGHSIYDLNGPLL